MRTQHWLVALTIALCATACAEPVSTEQTAKDTAMPDTTQESAGDNGHRYSSAPVEAMLGPHRFRFPANYYDDQIGPYVDGGIGITLLWPTLDAPAPGSRAQRTPQELQRQVMVSIDYLDSAPIATSLERLSSNDALSEPGSLERRDPRARLDLRVAQPEQGGLVPYTIDKPALDAWRAEYQQQMGAALPQNPRFEQDWYVQRGSDAALSTVIRCDSRAQSPDGLVVEGDDVHLTDSATVASCTHYISDLPDSLSIRITYARAFLGDWQKIEDHVRSLLKRYKVA